MSIMEALVILLFVVLIVLILSFRSAALQRIKNLEDQISKLRQELPRVPSAPPAPPAAPTAAATPAAPERVVTPEGPAVPQPVPAARQPASPPGPGFFERHPDLEKFIGENLVSKIGIAILVLAIGFFVKYAIDNDWIGPVGRVGIGLFFGGILVGIAHWLRNSYKAFSSVLVGGGLAIFYFTITLAYHQYALFGQATAFIIMLVITAFAVILSLLYDRQELAIIALAGGFAAPFLASNGSGNYQVLFSYLLILNAGLLFIAYNKAWRLLNALAFGFTALLFATWLIGLPDNTPVPTYDGGFIFATAFYILFFAINIAHNIRENKKFIASDFGILLVNTCLYFGAGLYLFAEMKLTQYEGLFSATMGVFNLLCSYFLFRTKKVDSNILYLLIGITLSFISLTAPIQLHGHYITLFWASETVLLYWLFLKSGIRLIRLSSFLIGGAMVISLMMDWGQLYFYNAFGPELNIHYDSLPIVLNKAFITGLYAAICCGVLFRMARKTVWASVTLIAGSVILYFTGALEIHYQFTTYFPGQGAAFLYLLLYTYLFILVYTYIATHTHELNSPWLRLVMPAAAIALYLLTLPATFSIQAFLLESHPHGSNFIAHWLGALIIAVLIYGLISKERAADSVIMQELFTWAVCIAIVLFVSSEGQLWVNTLFYSKEHSLEDLERIYIKTGLPILWGLCSFAFMWLGMRYKFKTLRIVSLLLFSLTLLKLFLFDIRNIPVAGKIAAFFCLGVLLLVVSFMYQRLKKIIIEDEEKKSV
jgi:uncharacterized membrane protein